MAIKSMNKNLIIFALCLTVLLAGTFLGFYGTSVFYQSKIDDEKFITKCYEKVKQGKAVKAAQNATVYKVRVANAQEGDAQQFRTLIGRLEEIRRSTISAEVNGKIVEIYVEKGSRVKEHQVRYEDHKPDEVSLDALLEDNETVVSEGTVIARIDTVWNELAVRQTIATIASLQAQYEFQESELKRAKQLNERGAVSQSDLESILAQRDELLATINAKKVQLLEFQKKLKRSTIYAPFDGQVIARHVDLGTYVSPGTPIVDVISSGQIDARIYVPENFIHQIEKGQTIGIQIDALKKTVYGKVVQVVANAETASRTFPVYVRFDDNDGELMAGLSVTARIPVTEKFRSLIVPGDSVIVKPDGNTIWIVRNRTPEEEEEAKIEAEEEGKIYQAGVPIVMPIPVRITAEMHDGDIYDQSAENQDGEKRKNGYVPKLYAVEPINENGRKYLKPGVSVVIEGGERLSPQMVVDVQESPYSLKPLPGQYDSGQQKINH
ncbi:MAG: efflux RND transporter periplasmic adaptor subunit [Planctomycetia bacterium]|nr:efflux RND transporter periplasmic adaptor subunit [Planctomycetia bacterium]